MSLEQLPDSVLLQVLSYTNVCDTLSLSQTCTRLRQLALDAPAGFQCASSAPACQQPTLRAVLAAADQRLHAVSGGTWKDALRLAAWQRQEQAANPPSSRVQAAPASAHTPLLQQVLRTPDAAAAFISGQLGSGTRSCVDTQDHDAAVSAAHDNSRRSRAASDRVAFSVFWTPSQAELAAASCFVTDGPSTMFLHPHAPQPDHSQDAAAAPAPAAASSQTPAGSAAPSAPPLPCTSGTAGTAPSSATDDPAGALGEAVPSLQSVVQRVGLCNDQQGQHLGLLHGHQPPADCSPRHDVPLHRLLHLPGHQHTTPSNSTAPSMVMDLGAYGLRHLLAFLAYVWAADEAPSIQDGSSSDASTGPLTKVELLEQALQDEEQPEQQRYHGPRQALLLPQLTPAGSISGLQLPWPPQLAPGSSYKGLGDPGCDVTSGFRSCPHLLRDAMINNEPALLMSAGITKSALLPRLEQFGVMAKPHWWAGLCHLDLSGQISVSDMLIGCTLNVCSSLQTLSIADTAAAALTFMLWPQRPAQDSPTEPQPAAAAPGMATGNACPGGARQVTAASQAPTTLHSRTQALRRALGLHAASESGSSRGGASSSGTVPSVSPSISRSVCVLKVLDVSGCAALAAGSGAAVFKSFQTALGHMPHLEVLLACRINADALLTCQCQETSPGTTAAASTPSGPKASTRAVSRSTSGLQWNCQQGCSFCKTLSGLLELDVSAATALSVNTLLRVLTSCSSLRRLGAAGCSTLAADNGSERLEKGLLQRAQAQSAVSDSNNQPPPPPPQQQQQQQVLSSSEGLCNNPAKAGTACSGWSGPQMPLQSSLGAVAGASDHQAAAAAAASHEVTEAGCVDEANAALQQSQPGYRVGQGLLRLCTGWGWSAAALTCLLRQAPFLISFTAGVGACVTDNVLQQLASSCPCLQHLSLSLCTVTSAGLSAVLHSCPHLTSLQLQQCVGPITVASMLHSNQHTQAANQQQQQTVVRSHSKQRWQVSTLQLSGPRTVASDKELLQLLGLQQQQQHQPLPQQQQQQSTGGSSATQGASSVRSVQQAAVAAVTSQLHQLSVAHPSAAPATAAYLTSLCLVRVEGLTDALLLQLAAAGCRLQHLRLEDCFTCLKPHGSAPASCSIHTSHSDDSGCDEPGKGPSSSDAASIPPSCRDGLVHSFSASAVLQLAGSSCSLSLRSLTLRHAAKLPKTFVAALVKTAPLLQRLVLDACDLTGGYELEPDSYRALSAVHVIRCRAVTGAASLGGHHDEASHHESHSATAAPAGRVVDKELLVHMLNLGRSIHLPPG